MDDEVVSTSLIFVYEKTTAQSLRKKGYTFSPTQRALDTL